MREAATICPRPCKLTFDLLTMKVVSESRVTSATSMPILVFLDFSIYDSPDVCNRQTSDAHHPLIPPPYGGGGIIIISVYKRMITARKAALKHYAQLPWS